MDFDFTEEQRLLKESVDRLVADRYEFEQRKALPPDAGRLEPRRSGRNTPSSACSACLSPRRMAASAAAPVETMIVMEAFGRALVLEPYLRDRRAGRRPRCATPGSERSAQTLVPQIAEGKLACSPSPMPSGSRATTSPMSRRRARRDGGGWVLEGDKSVVLHGDRADQAGRHRAHAGGARDTRRHRRCSWSMPSAPGVVAARLPDAGRPAGRRDRARVRRGRGRRRARRAGKRRCRSIEHVVDEAIAALCAEAVGAMEAMHAPHASNI